MVDEVVTITFCYDGLLDKVKSAEAIALGVFQDERPVKGITGFVDWRLHGMLSRLLMRQRVTGELMESLLMPARGRIPMEKVFIFGLGPVVDFDVSRFSRITEEIVSTMTKVRADQFILSIWDLSRGRVAPEEAAGIFYRQLLADLEAREGRSGARVITFVERGPWGRALRNGFRQISDRSAELPLKLEVR